MAAEETRFPGHCCDAAGSLGSRPCLDPGAQSATAPSPAVVAEAPVPGAKASHADAWRPPIRSATPIGSRPCLDPGAQSATAPRRPSVPGATVPGAKASHADAWRPPSEGPTKTQLLVACGDEKRVRRPVSRVLSSPLPGLCDHSSGARIAAGFARPTRAEGRDRPCDSALPHLAVRPYSALLPVGFAVPPPLPEARWALTPPFHPCRGVSPRRGGLFSVALSLGSPPPVVDRHRSPVEPGLSSSAGSLPRQRSPSRLTARGVRWACADVKRGDAGALALRHPSWLRDSVGPSGGA